MKNYNGVKGGIEMKYNALLHTNTDSLNAQAEPKQKTIMNLDCSNCSSVSRPISIYTLKKRKITTFREFTHYV